MGLVSPGGGGGGQVVEGNRTPADAYANPTDALDTIGLESVWNGATWEPQRTPNKFKTGLATAAGDTAVWTPAAGKKFRLMGYAIYVTANASQAVAGLLEIVLRDATTAIGLGYSVFVPGAAGTAFVDSSDSSWIQLGNGFLSGAADRVLNVNLSAAFATGEVRVTCCGTEE